MFANKRSIVPNQGESKKEIADSLKLPATTIFAWTRGINPRKRIPIEVKQEAVRRVEAGEQKSAVALDLGLSPMTVSQLTKHIKQGETPPEIRQAFIGRVNKGESLAAVSRDLGVSVHAYHSWRESGLAPYPEYSAETQAAVLDEIQKRGTISDVALKYSASRQH